MRPARFVRETITLRDGREVVLRPIDRDDADGLIRFHNHLSPDSQYFRFFGPKPRLSAAEAAYLAGVDHHRRFAIVGEAEEAGEKNVVGVGRFDINEPGLAEAAIVIRDDYQHVGLGTAILQRMTEVARGRALKAFTAEVLAENTKMLELLTSNGYQVEPPQGGVVRVTAPIERPILLKGLQIVALTAETILERRAAKRDSN